MQTRTWDAMAVKGGREKETDLEEHKIIPNFGI